MAKLNRWKGILSSMANALGGKTRRKKAEKDPFDIFPDWFKSNISNNKDREINQEKDGVTTGVDNYLARKKSHKKFTPTTYNGASYNKKVPFSSPDAEQEIAAPTNMGEYNELENPSIEYADPIISTKVTPTSERLKVPRPGPSTFIQTARYNPQTKQLNVMYTDGKIFPYQNVSLELADRILNKKAYHSPGQEMLNTIFKGHGTTKADEIADIEEGM